MSKTVVKPCPICGSSEGVHERWLDAKHESGGPFELSRCADCSFVFTNLPDDRILQANSGFDEKDTASYTTNQTALDQLWFDRICEQISKNVDHPHPRVLDVGCGNGFLLQRFKSRGWEVYGVDLSSWAEQAAEQISFRLFRGAVESVRIPSGHFDVVTSTSTLEHIPNLVPHIHAVLRAVKPGGKAYFAGMPNYGSLTVRTGTSAFHHNRPPRHANWFTPRSLRLLFNHPDIRAAVASVSVRTYGLPELHRFYNVAQGSLRKTFRRRARSEPKHVIERTGGGVSKLILKRMLDLNYYAGRPFGLGDKLEVSVTVV